MKFTVVSSDKWVIDAVLDLPTNPALKPKITLELHHPEDKWGSEAILYIGYDVDAKEVFHIMADSRGLRRLIWSMLVDQLNSYRPQIDEIIAQQLAGNHVEPIPNYGDVMTIEEFVSACRNHSFIDYDGHGKYATKYWVSNKTVSPSQLANGEPPPGYTHVVWYNR